jgi:hypothetical protein
MFQKNTLFLLKVVDPWSKAREKIEESKINFSFLRDPVANICIVSAIARLPAADKYRRALCTPPVLCTTSLPLIKAPRLMHVSFVNYSNTVFLCNKSGDVNFFYGRLTD